MKASAPPLLPLLRSENQARILTTILLAPEREFTLTELADQVEASLPTVTREIRRAEEAGIVAVHRVGRSKIVRANTESVLNEPLTQLLLVSFGPGMIASDELAGIDGIEEAFIFGSWAARYAGHPGPSPQDVDVLVIGSPDRDDVYAAADRIEKRIDRPVQVTFRSRRRWEEPGDDPFLGEVQQRPLVRIMPPEGEVR
jgi:DNA-binding transcriptional ArsR family regulator